ncbi:MAG: hypothetical protein FJ184_14635 [Gammaproteobacteria bacterium]|nr:hypothetical protein [Gammaproteobacteria bacterium]
MKKRKTKRSEESDPPISEDEYFEQTAAIADAQEWKEWMKWLGELRRLKKEQLVQLLSESRDREDELWSVIMRRNNRLANVEHEIRKLQAERERRLANQTKGRREKVDTKSAEYQAIALGVDSFYGLLREAIVHLKNNPRLQETKPTKVSAIRGIIVTLLCEPNRSRHTYNQTKWAGIVRGVVTSPHVQIAENQLKRKIPTSF